MSFQTLKPEDRDKWRSLPETRAAIEYLRSIAKGHGEKALGELRGGDRERASQYAGAEEGVRVAANYLESD